MKNLINNKLHIILIVLLFIPLLSFGQDPDDGFAGAIGGFTDGLKGLHGTISNMYHIQKGKMGGVIRSVSTILAIGIFFYIFSRVYKALLAAEPIDFWSLTKPIVVFILVIAYPVVLQLVELGLNPILSTTESMNYASYERFIDKRQELMKQNPYYNVLIGEDGQGDFEEYFKKYTNDSNLIPDAIEKGVARFSFQVERSVLIFQNKIKMVISELFRLFYEAAILCINFIRTFYLIVLAIMGPIAFSISLLPGMSQQPIQWLLQYIGKFMWLPVANVLASMLNEIQIQMISSMEKLTIGGGGIAFFSPTDVSSIVFLIIGIVGFFCVPSISSMILSVAGVGAGSLGGKAAGVITAPISAAAGVATMAAGAAVGGAVGAAGASKAQEKKGGMASKIKG